jgi:hypothetical protein
MFAGNMGFSSFPRFHTIDSHFLPGYKSKHNSTPFKGKICIRWMMMMM